MPPIRLCALCQKQRPLAESHIIPDWMYEKAKDEGGGFISATAHPHHRPRYVQRGYCEHLLCMEGCETVLSRWEGRARKDVQRIIDADAEPGKVEVPDVDQDNLILFAWSVLWRAATASGVVISDVDLGPLQEPVRQALLSGDARGLDHLPVMLVRHDGSELFTRSIMVPYPFKVLGITGFRMVAVGITWFWALSPRRARWIAEAYGEWLWLGGQDPLTVAIAPTNDDRFARQLKTMIERRGMM